MTKDTKANKKLARKPRGFPDKREALIHAERDMIERVTGVYRKWGFEALETGAFEYADALGKFLPDDDRPNAGVFALQDDDEQWMSLRYDLTAPLARFAAENWNQIAKPLRRYAAGPVWRNEKPGPGRFREFLQCDADTVGAGGPHVDAEMIAMAAEAMRAAGAETGEFVIRYSHRKLLDGMLEHIKITEPNRKLTIMRSLDKLDRLGAAGVAELLGAGRKDESGDFTLGAGLRDEDIEYVMAYLNAASESRSSALTVLGSLAAFTESGTEALKEIEQINSAMKALGIVGDEVVLDPSIVRGLAYYTGPVFEAELLKETRDEKGRKVRIGSVGGGGRYDDLVTRFTGNEVPATGFSVGISRLAAAFSLTGDVQKLDGPIVVLNLNKEDPSLALALATEIRQAGLRAEAYMGASGMRPQMKYADRRASPAVVIVGEDEEAKGTVTIKDLEVGAAKAKAIKSNEEWRETRPGQIEVPRDEMIAELRKIVEQVS